MALRKKVQEVMTERSEALAQCDSRGTYALAYVLLKPRRHQLAEITCTFVHELQPSC
jgi:hypothetical protein